MKPFDISKRRAEIIRLDNVSNHGTNYGPYKNELINANTIDLLPEDTIYRIFGIDSFIKTLSSKKLCLVRPSMWQDPFENFLLNSVGQLANGTAVGLGSIRDNYYGQCWTLKKECDGLWRNYKGTEPSAIKVKTTVRKLMNELYDLTNKFHMLSYFIGKVNYVPETEIENFFKNDLDIMSFQSGLEFVQTLLVKRLSFSYEEEVRIIFGKLVTDEIDLNKVKNPWGPDDKFFVNFDPNTLFLEIEIDPWIKKDDFENLKNEITDMGYSGQVTRSTLYDKPFFVTKIGS